MEELSSSSIKKIGLISSKALLYSCFGMPKLNSKTGDGYRVSSKADPDLFCMQVKKNEEKYYAYLVLLF